MNRVAAQKIDFRRLEPADFAMLTAWLAQSHVRQFYQRDPVSLEEVTLEYGTAVAGDEPTICSLALSLSAPFGYLQCYRNADYPEWADIIGIADGISVDLFIGEPNYLGRGFGRAALSEYLRQVAFPSYPGETRAYIAHEPSNLAALRCSQAIGFRPLRSFLENGIETVLLSMEKPVGW